MYLACLGHVRVVSVMFHSVVANRRQPNLCTIYILQYMNNLIYMKRGGRGVLLACHLSCRSVGSALI